MCKIIMPDFFIQEQASLCVIACHCVNLSARGSVYKSAYVCTGPCVNMKWGVYVQGYYPMMTDSTSDLVSFRSPI